MVEVLGVSDTVLAIRNVPALSSVPKTSAFYLLGSMCVSGSTAHVELPSQGSSLASAPGGEGTEEGRAPRRVASTPLLPKDTSTPPAWVSV